MFLRAAHAFSALPHPLSYFHLDHPFHFFAPIFLFGLNLDSPPIRVSSTLELCREKFPEILGARLLQPLKLLDAKINRTPEKIDPERPVLTRIPIQLLDFQEKFKNPLGIQAQRLMIATTVLVETGDVEEHI